MLLSSERLVASSSRERRRQLEIRRGRTREAFASFLRAFDRDPERAETIYWEARTGRELGLLTPPQIEQLIASLRELGSDEARRYADELAGAAR